MLEFKSHTTFEITEKFTKNFGHIAFNLNKKGLLLEHKKEFINFYKEMLIHEEIKIKCLGIYFLPCMHILFKNHQEECEIDFGMTY